ncbi:MAG: two-component sensor histidine kinase, partial [Bacteroidota bacterium]|nr:two-component sensor histidine kinase [Bacteroidota bacterium]
MNKKLFVLLVVLMSLSLLGIIFVQVYWIRTSINDKEEQFSRTVTDILDKVASRVEKREMKEYSDQLASLADSIGEPKGAQYKKFMFMERDLNSDEILFYSHGILEEDYNITSAFFDNKLGGSDTTTLKNFTSLRTKSVFKEEFGLDGKSYSLTPIEKVTNIGKLDKIERAAWEDVFMEYSKTQP